MPARPAKTAGPGLRDCGAATVEYVGALVVATLLVLTVVAVATPLGGQAAQGVSLAYCRITGALGGAGCTNAQLPGYLPTECTISTAEGAAGGSVKIVIVEVGADGSYELAQVRRRQDDGSYATTWVLTTARGGSTGVDIDFGAAAKADTGDGSAGGGASLGVNVALQGQGGTSYEFSSEDDARDAIDAWKSQNDLNPLTDDIEAPAQTRFYTGGVRIGATGEASALSGDAAGAVIVGYTEHQRTGDRTVSMVTEQSVAAELGIPLPEQFLAAQASGSAQRELGLSVTYDREGRMVAVQVSLVGTVDGSVSAGVDTDQLVDGAGGVIEDLSLPTSVDFGAGREYELTYSADFRRPDGSVDTAAYGGAGAAMALFISTGELPSKSNVQMFEDFLNENSQVVFNTYDYSQDEDQYGGELKIGPVALGGEVHLSSTDRQLLSGYYYDPALGTWAERVDCAS